MPEILEIRECETLEELSECVALQREAFALPEVELSPVRHFVVTRNAGGFTLGAYEGDRLAGFVLSVPAFHHGGRAFYSHMTGVRPEFQGRGVGARLKWAQRSRALSQGVKYIKWTFEPVKSRNAYFNLEKLGATVREYQVNFYGPDYATQPGSQTKIGLQSDRLFAEWDLESPKVRALAAGEAFTEPGGPAVKIEIMNDWQTLAESDPARGLGEQLRIRSEFVSAFERGLVGRAFRRDEMNPSYLLYSE